MLEASEDTMNPRRIKSIYVYIQKIAPHYLNLPGGSWQKTQVQVMTARKTNSQIQWNKLAQTKAICCPDSYIQTSVVLTKQCNRKLVLCLSGYLFLLPFLNWSTSCTQVLPVTMARVHSKAEGWPLNSLNSADITELNIKGGHSLITQYGTTMPNKQTLPILFS